MAFTRKTAIVAQRRKGTDDDPYVNITETFVVKDNKVLLSEVPDRFNKVLVKDNSNGKVYVEVFDDFVLDADHYRVDYSMGFVEFANSENNKALEFSYSGTGIYLFPASRVWTKLNLSNNAAQTLEEMLTITNGQIGTLSNLTTTNKASLVSAINELDNDKVDKVTGKKLSTEDYTTAEKTKLSGIASGANNYTHPTSHPASMVTVTDSGNHYNSSNVEGALAEVKDEVERHEAENMPHRIHDLKNNKVYNFGLQISAEGNPQIIYEEVI